MSISINDLRVAIFNKETNEFVAMIKDEELAMDFIMHLKGKFEARDVGFVEALRRIDCSGLAVDYKGDLFEAVMANNEEVIDLLTEGEIDHALAVAKGEEYDG